MPKINYVNPDGVTFEVEAANGQSVMAAARAAAVDGIVAICGGSMMCGTCHVIVDDDWTERVGPPGDDEAAVLEALDSRALVTDASRLSCQIAMTGALDGLTVHLPPYQPGV